ncbi:hypothetical protein [Myroides sp. LJL119]
MKKYWLFLIFMFLYISCNTSNTQDIKVNYINKIVPLVKNLPEEDINLFKKSMIFERNGILSSWDNNLLRVAYKENKEEYEKAIVYIMAMQGVDITKPIFLIDSENNETRISAKFTDINGKKYEINEILSLDGLILFSSLKCGYCLEEYANLNDLSEKFSQNNFKFIAFVDNLEFVDNYKKTNLFKNFGFLNDNWIIINLEKEIINSVFKDIYNTEYGYPYSIFKKDEKIIKIDRLNYEKLDSIFTSAN